MSSAKILKLYLFALSAAVGISIKGLFMEMRSEITTTDYPKNNPRFAPIELLRQSRDAPY